MCFATAGLIAGIAGAGISAGGSILGGQATANAAHYQSEVAANNAIIAQNNATYAEQAGTVAATNKSLQGAQVAGKIKAGQGASNIDVNTGSAKEVQAGQAVASKLDTETVLNNSELQAYGYRTAAVSNTAQSQLDQFTANEAPIGADIGATGSLLSGASSLSSKWSQSGGTGGGFNGITVPGFNPIAGASGSPA